jgi:hypothetical protein
MERWGNPLYPVFNPRRRLRVVSRSHATPWRDALGRGAILGGVIACHIAILMPVLHPSWHWTGHVARLQDDDVLRLNLDPFPETSRLSPAHASPHAPAGPKSGPSATVTHLAPSNVIVHPADSPTSTTTIQVIAPPPTSSDLAHSYQPGKFQAALQDAQRTKIDHIPGITTPLIGGIRLQATPSIKETFHSLVEISRCTNEQFQLQNRARQFTTELIDHALEMEGCGPHLEHAGANATIDAISRHAIFGN